MRSANSVAFFGSACPATTEASTDSTAVVYTDDVIAAAELVAMSRTAPPAVPVIWFSRAAIAAWNRDCRAPPISPITVAMPACLTRPTKPKSVR